MLKNCIITIKNNNSWKAFKGNPIGWLGLSLIIIMVFGAVFANFLTPYDPTHTDWLNVRKPPSMKHIFGTDTIGRDEFTRLLFGARSSLLAGICSVIIALVIGIPFGMISAYFGGIIDTIISRITDAMMSIPSLILAIAISAAMGASLVNVMLAIGIANMPIFIRLTRGQSKNIMALEYIEAAHSVGVSHMGIISKYIFPNIISPLLIQSSLSIAGAIIAESSLSFLGLGLQPPDPSWGSMLNSAKDFLESASWMAIFPGMAILITVLGFNLFGDALRDALDPKQK